jgi:hypothetical protein
VADLRVDDDSVVHTAEPTWPVVGRVGKPGPVPSELG